SGQCLRCIVVLFSSHRYLWQPQRSAYIAPSVATDVDLSLTFQYRGRFRLKRRTRDGQQPVLGSSFAGGGPRMRTHQPTQMVDFALIGSGGAALSAAFRAGTMGVGVM